MLNKIDRVPEPGLIRLWQRRLEPAVAISARTGAGIGDLIAYINSWMTRRMPRVCLRLPLSEGSAIDRIYKNGTVLHTEYRGADVLLEAQLDYAVAQSLRAVFHTAVQKKTCERKMLMNHQPYRTRSYCAHSSPFSLCCSVLRPGNPCPGRLYRPGNGPYHCC